MGGGFWSVPISLVGVFLFLGVCIWKGTWGGKSWVGRDILSEGILIVEDVVEEVAHLATVSWQWK
jgi:hypothetical protein